MTAEFHNFLSEAGLVSLVGNFLEPFEGCLAHDDCQGQEAELPGGWLFLVVILFWRWVFFAWKKAAQPEIKNEVFYLICENVSEKEVGLLVKLHLIIGLVDCKESWDKLIFILLCGNLLPLDWVMVDDKNILIILFDSGW